MANHERGREDRDGDRNRDGGGWRRGFGAEGPARNWNRNVAFGHGGEDESGENRNRDSGSGQGTGYGSNDESRFAEDHRGGGYGRNDPREGRRDQRSSRDRDDFSPDYMRDYAPVDRDRNASRHGTAGPRGFGSTAGYPGSNLASRNADPETARDYTRPLERERRPERDVWSRASEAVASVFGEADGDRWRRDPDGEQGHRGRGPKGYARSDERIRADINERLAYDSWVDASEIEVTVIDRDVTLSGRVDGRDARRRAEAIAEHVSGVAHVNNNLRVNRNTDHPTGPDKSWRTV